MHVCSVSYHRIQFSNVTDYPSLQELSIVLDLEVTEHPDIFDLVQDEGSALTAKEAIELIGEAYGLYDGEDQSINTVLSALRDKVVLLGYQPHTRIFHDDYHNPAIETDINPDELYDLLTVMAANYFMVENITTQWAVFSDRNLPGAHSGGSRIVTRDFNIPVIMHIDELETAVNGYAKHQPHEAGDYYVNKFVSPLVDEHAIKNEALRKSVARALIRSASMELEPEEVHDILASPSSKTVNPSEDQMVMAAISGIELVTDK